MPEPTTPPAEPAALTEYRRRTARSNRIYAGVLAALVLAAFIGVRLAYAHGEVDRVSFRTSAPASPVPGATPATTLRRAWQTADSAAAGTPYDSGVVVTYAGHTVNGRDAVTGAVRWHYTRTDELLCSVVQQDASTIAIYRRKGNCDEVTGFVTATGEPKWYRTLTDDGETTAASTSNVVLTVNAHTVHAFDNAGGLDRWDWAVPTDCTVRQALAGSLGVLVSLDCSGGRHQLALHDLIADTVKWTVGSPTAMLPIATDAFVGAVDPATGTVYRYTPDKGQASVSAQLGGPVSPLPAGSQAAQALASVSATDAAGQPVQLVSLSTGPGGTGASGTGAGGTGAGGTGALFAFSGDGSLRWRVAATGPARPVSTAFAAALSGPGTAVLHRVETGKTQLSSSLVPPATAGDERIFPVGSGLLVTGNGTSLYR